MSDRDIQSNQPAAEGTVVDLLGILRSCTQRLRTAAASCDSVPATATSFAENEVPLEVWDMPRQALREAWIVAGQLTVFCSLMERRITATEDAAEDLELLATVQTSAKRLIVAWNCCNEFPLTITEFIDKIISGYSTYDMPLDQLREASLAAGILVASAEALDWSIADLLAEVSVRNQLVFRGAAS